MTLHFEQREEANMRVTRLLTAILTAAFVLAASAAGLAQTGASGLAA